MIKAVGLFILWTAIVFGGIATLGIELSFKEKTKLFAGLEVFLALLIIGAYILVG